jgi:UDP-N-acetylmuramate--alanine ligase
VIFEDKIVGNVKLNVPGIHYACNALAAVCVGLELGVESDVIVKALNSYSGVQRRFQIIDEIKDVLIIDDYAHHPTEISATLTSLKNNDNRRIISVFQPHRYTRTKAMARKFGMCFDDADIVVVTNIYPAGEEPIEGVDASLIVKSLIESGHSQVMFLQTFDEIIEFLYEIVTPGDIVVTLGAGDIWKVGVRLVDRLNDRE